MAIAVDKNSNYGGTLVTEKYTPLRGIGYVNTDAPIYNALLTNRAAMIDHAGLRGTSLRLAMPNWTRAIQREGAAGRPPPLVVISSNRSGWIVSGIAAGDLQGQSLPGQPQTFIGPGDLNALTALAGQKQSPPFYAARRVGVGRGIYVVVEMREYTKYRDALANTGITVVGWNFVRATGPAGARLVGFGASRYAAMEFCKYLRRQAQAPWNLVWLLDDNVVALSNFPGFAALEGLVGANACVGFQGGTSAEPARASRDWALHQLANPQQPPALQSQTPGVVQQAAIWNVDYLDNNHLNFGPAFINSAEDLSIVKYLDAIGRGNPAYRYYTQIIVRKEEATLDDDLSAQSVNDARNELTRWMTRAESQKQTPGTGQAPPPPLLVDAPVADRDGLADGTLGTYILDRVLPVSQLKTKQKDIPTQTKAKSNGVEQIVTGAIGTGWVAAASIDAIFRINGAGQQPVTQA